MNLIHEQGHKLAILILRPKAKITVTFFQKDTQQNSICNFRGKINCDCFGTFNSLETRIVALSGFLLPVILSCLCLLLPFQHTYLIPLSIIIIGSMNLLPIEGYDGWYFLYPGKVKLLE